jgi:hypothetical protein
MDSPRSTWLESVFPDEVFCFRRGAESSRSFSNESLNTGINKMKRSLMMMIAAGAMMFAVAGTASAGHGHGGSGFGISLNLGNAYGGYNQGYSTGYRSQAYAPRSYSNYGRQQVPSYRSYSTPSYGYRSTSYGQGYGGGGYGGGGYGGGGYGGGGYGGGGYGRSTCGYR